MNHQISSLPTLEENVAAVLAAAQDRKVWFFYGEIGAGKTTFIKSLCRQLGAEEGVTSPSFSLINEYEYSDPQTGGPAFIYHIDLYRLESLEEALNIGIEDYLEGSHYCLIEWPQIIEGIAPEDVFKINIEILENSSRKIIFL